MNDLRQGRLVVLRVIEWLDEINTNNALILEGVKKLKQALAVALADRDKAIAERDALLAEVMAWREAWEARGIALGKIFELTENDPTGAVHAIARDAMVTGIDA